MGRLYYKAVAKQDGAFILNGKPVSNRLHRVQSPKGGSDADKFLKDFLEIIDVLTLPVGFVEANCEYLLRSYYKSNGREGWSEKKVFDFLIKLKRKPSYVLDFITSIKLSTGGKDNDENKTTQEQKEKIQA